MTGRRVLGMYFEIRVAELERQNQKELLSALLP